MVQLIELGHVGVGELEAKGADVLLQVLPVSGLRQDDEIVLQTPANQDLRR